MFQAVHCSPSQEAKGVHALGLWRPLPLMSAFSRLQVWEGIVTNEIIYDLLFNFSKEFMGKCGKKFWCAPGFFAEFLFVPIGRKLREVRKEKQKSMALDGSDYTCLHTTSDDSSCIGSSRHQPTSNPEGNSGNATGRALAKSVIRDIRCHFLGRLTTCFVAQTPSSPLFKANFSESSSCSQESSSPSDSNSEGEGEEEHFQDNQDFELVFIAPSSKCFCPVSFMKWKCIDAWLRLESRNVFWPQKLVHSSVCQLLVHQFFALFEPDLRFPWMSLFKLHKACMSLVWHRIINRCNSFWHLDLKDLIWQRQFLLWRRKSKVNSI